MKNSITTIFISIVFSFYGIAQSKNSFFILEKTGKQRMLCEQMTKNYLMILSNIKIDEAKIELDQSRSEFNENLVFLDKSLISDITRVTLNNIETNWSIFKEKLSSKPSKENIDEFMNLSNLISGYCNELTAKVYIENDFKNARMLNLCNKQKTNTQKIAKNFVALNSEFADKNDYINLINETITSFEFSLSLLKNLAINNQLLTENLKKTELEWIMIKDSFNYKSASYNLTNVLSNTDKINKLTTKFSDLVQTNLLQDSKLTKL